jgi:hypothetical protein
MDAERYLQAAEAAGRVKWLAKFENGELLGRAGALVVDEHECIAVLIEDGTLPADPQLRPGQVVKYEHSSKVGGPIIIDSANLRGDKPEEPAENAAKAATATPATSPARESGVACEESEARPYDCP